MRVNAICFFVFLQTTLVSSTYPFTHPPTPSLMASSPLAVAPSLQQCPASWADIVELFIESSRSKQWISRGLLLRAVDNSSDRMMK